MLINQKSNYNPRTKTNVRTGTWEFLTIKGGKLWLKELIQLIRRYNHN